MTRFRKFCLAVFGSAFLMGGGVLWANWQVEQATRDRIFLSAVLVPKRQVGIVLGTSPRTHGHPNPFFERRLDAAAELYRARRVRCLLVSGDHGSRYYNEVEAMRKGLIRRGVPAARIAMDHAGFRTLDSLVRARKVFGVTSAVVVTDGFHLPRSLYLAGSNGINAVGLSSAPISTRIAPRPAKREIAARALMMIDMFLGRQPKFLGPHVELPG